jgi:hypothetical protein
MLHWIGSFRNFNNPLIRLALFFSTLPSRNSLFGILTGRWTDPSGRAVCGPSLAGVVGFNPVWDMNVCLLWMLFFVTWRSLRRADHSSRRVLPDCDREASTVRRVWPTRGCCAIGKKDWAIASIIEVSISNLSVIRQVYTASEAYAHSYRVETIHFFPRLKGSGRQVGHPPSCSVSVKNEWRLTSTPRICFNDVRRDNLVFVSSWAEQDNSAL